jgi:phosphoserine aminotransferase
VTTIEAAGALAPREKPDTRPARPFFSSGPCAKPPGWSAAKLPVGSLGRSHRSRLGKARLLHAIDLIRYVLGVPAADAHAVIPLRHADRDELLSKGPTRIAQQPIVPPRALDRRIYLT